LRTSRSIIADTVVAERPSASAASVGVAEPAACSQLASANSVEETVLPSTTRWISVPTSCETT
jgi:hypothetical protein